MPPTYRSAAGLQFAGISHLLLDIEGTTCPVSFVADVLFPFAAQNLPVFLGEAAEDSAVLALVEEVNAAWKTDPHPEARRLREGPGRHTSMSPGSLKPAAVVPYLLWLIREDRKLPPLKELQGMVWERGYQEGRLKAPLFPDVAVALRHWHAAGLTLAVYSSGSVAAQKLIYRFSDAGDLCSLFSFWFDTRVGSKLEAGSYQSICATMGVAPHKVLFVSDSLKELDAAAEADVRVVFSLRNDNPQRDPGRYPWLRSLLDVSLEPHPGGDGLEKGSP